MAPPFPNSYDIPTQVNTRCGTVTDWTLSSRGKDVNGGFLPACHPRARLRHRRQQYSLVAKVLIRPGIPCGQYDSAVIDVVRQQERQSLSGGVEQGTQVVVDTFGVQERRAAKRRAAVRVSDDLAPV